MGAFHLPGLVTQMDTLQDAANTQPITIKARHISINPHTFRHVLPIHEQTQIKSHQNRVLRTPGLFCTIYHSLLSFFLIPIHWYCSSSNACICMIGLNELATNVLDGSKKICSLGTSKQPRTASLTQTMQHTKYKNLIWSKLHNTEQREATAILTHAALSPQLGSNKISPHFCNFIQIQCTSEYATLPGNFLIKYLLAKTVEKGQRLVLGQSASGLN